MTSDIIMAPDQQRRRMAAVSERIPIHTSENQRINKDQMELVDVGERVFAAECIQKRRIRKVGGESAIWCVIFALFRGIWLTHYCLVRRDVWNI